MTTATFIRKHFTGAGLQLRGLVYYHHGAKRGSTWADMFAREEAERSMSRQAGTGQEE